MATTLHIANYEQARYHYIKYDYDDAKQKGLYIDCNRNSPRLIKNLPYDSTKTGEFMRIYITTRDFGVQNQDLQINTSIYSTENGFIADSHFQATQAILDKFKPDEDGDWPQGTIQYFDTSMNDHNFPIAPSPKEVPEKYLWLPLENYKNQRLYIYVLTYQTKANNPNCDQSLLYNDGRWLNVLAFPLYVNYFTTIPNDPGNFFFSYNFSGDTNIDLYTYTSNSEEIMPGKKMLDYDCYLPKQETNNATEIIDPITKEQNLVWYKQRPFDLSYAWNVYDANADVYFQAWTNNISNWVEWYRFDLMSTGTPLKLQVKYKNKTYDLFNSYVLTGDKNNKAYFYKFKPIIPENELNKIEPEELQIQVASYGVYAGKTVNKIYLNVATDTDIQEVYAGLKYGPGEAEYDDLDNETPNAKGSYNDGMVLKFQKISGRTYAIYVWCNHGVQEGQHPAYTSNVLYQYYDNRILFEGKTYYYDDVKHILFERVPNSSFQPFFTNPISTDNFIMSINNSSSVPLKDLSLTDGYYMQSLPTLNEYSNWSFNALEKIANNPAILSFAYSIAQNTPLCFVKQNNTWDIQLNSNGSNISLIIPSTSRTIKKLPDTLQLIHLGDKSPLFFSNVSSSTFRTKRIPTFCLTDTPENFLIPESDLFVDLSHYDSDTYPSYQIQNDSNILSTTITDKDQITWKLLQFNNPEADTAYVDISFTTGKGYYEGIAYSSKFNNDGGDNPAIVGPVSTVEFDLKFTVSKSQTLPLKLSIEYKTYSYQGYSYILAWFKLQDYNGQLITLDEKDYTITAKEVNS